MSDDLPTPPTEVPPWEHKEKAPRGGKIRSLVAWSLVLAVVGLIAWGLRPHPIEVETGVVARGPLTVYVIEEGKTRIRNRYVLSAPVDGHMRRVDLRPGAPVEANKTLLTAIEPSLAPLLDARSKATAEARIQANEAARLLAEQSLAAAVTGRDFALTNWNRVKNLHEKGTISGTDRDIVEREYQLRDRETRRAEFALKVAEYELAQAKAALLQIESPATDASIEVRSPVSGSVLRVLQESAAVVRAGTPILEVGDPSDIEIEAEILSRDAVTIVPGARAEIEQWGGDTPLTARVHRVEPAAFTKISALGVEEQRVIVRCDLVDPPRAAEALGDRFRVDVKVAVWRSDDSLLIPAGALFREGNRWKTFLFDHGRARNVAVEAGRTDGRTTQVLDGLAAGTEVLLHPPDSVKDGSTVKKRGK